MKAHGLLAYALAIFTTMLVGCATLRPCLFAVSGTVVDFRSEQAPTPKQLYDAVESSVGVFGFTGDKISRFSYDLGDYNIFPGESLSIMLDPKTLRISPRDNNRSDESEMVKKISSSMQAQVTDVFGARIDFEQTRTC